MRFRSSFCIAAQARAGQRRPAAAVRQLRHARRLTQTRRNGIGPGARKPGAPCGQRRFVYNSRRAAGNCLLPTALEPALAVRILFWARFVPLLGRSGFFFRPRLKNQRGRLHRQTTESSYQAKNALSPAASARALNGSLHTSRLARSAARSAPLRRRCGQSMFRIVNRTSVSRETSASKDPTGTGRDGTGRDGTERDGTGALPGAVQPMDDCTATCQATQLGCRIRP